MILFMEDEKGKSITIEGTYKEQIMCLRGILAALNNSFGISPEELLEFAISSDKEQGNSIDKLYVLFRFSKGNTCIKQLTSVQQEAIRKILDFNFLEGEIKMADDFFIQ